MRCKDSVFPGSFYRGRGCGQLTDFVYMKLCRIFALPIVELLFVLGF